MMRETIKYSFELLNKQMPDSSKTSTFTKGKSVTRILSWNRIMCPRICLTSHNIL